MKLKIKNDKVAISLGVYLLFTIACGCFSWMLCEQRILVFQLWYQVTAVIWLVLTVTALVLLTKLQKINKLRNEIKNWKE